MAWKQKKPAALAERGKIMTEEINNSVELTDEEIEKAAGGTKTYMRFTCKNCGKPNVVAWNRISAEIPCQFCGYYNLIAELNN